MVAPPRLPPPPSPIPPPRSPAGSFVFPYYNKSERPNMMIKKKIPRVLRKGTFGHSPAHRRPCWKDRPLGMRPQPSPPPLPDFIFLLCLHISRTSHGRYLPGANVPPSTQWPPGIGPSPNLTARPPPSALQPGWLDSSYPGLDLVAPLADLLCLSLSSALAWSQSREPLASPPGSALVTPAEGRLPLPSLPQSTCHQRTGLAHSLGVCSYPPPRPKPLQSRDFVALYPSLCSVASRVSDSW